MRINIFLFVVMIISVLSCEQKAELNYSREKLVDITKDLYIAAESIRRIDEVRADSLRKLYNEQIESIHQVELALYEEDIKILKKDSKKYLEFHKIVRDTVQAINDSIKAERSYKNGKKK